MGISFLRDSYLYRCTVVWMYCTHQAKSSKAFPKSISLHTVYTVHYVYITDASLLDSLRLIPPAQPGSCCMRGGVNRMQRMLNTVTSRMGLWSPSSPEDEEGGNSLYGSPSGAVGTFRINAPGQRFTATHGIAMRKGMEKNMM